MFFLAALIILSAMHYYAFSHLRAAWPGMAGMFAVALGTMLSLPFLLFASRRWGIRTMTRLLARTAFSWIGFLFVGLTAFALFDLTNLLLGLIGQPHIGARAVAFGAAGTTLVAIAYGRWEAKTPRLKTIAIPSAKLAHLSKPIRLVQITDLHLGYVANQARLQLLVDRINALAPDVLVSTGDLFDGDFARMGPLVESLRGCSASFGKYAVSGNHEVYENLEAGVRLAEGCGFRVLRGESLLIGDTLRIAGVDDDEAYSGDGAEAAESRALGFEPDDRYTILLKHRPAVRRTSIGRFDLQLSGHTHGGQIFPFNIITRLVYPAKPGLSRHGQYSWLYLSRGTGTWGPQIRLFAPPELTLFELGA